MSGATSSDLIGFRPSYKYDSYLCKRVSAAARDLVFEISSGLTRLEDADAGSGSSSASRLTYLSPRPYPRVKDSSDNKIAIKQNINSYPRPREIGPKFQIEPPRFLNTKSKAGGLFSRNRNSNSKRKKKIPFGGLTSPRIKVASVRKTTCPPRSAILSTENVRAVLESRCIQRVINDHVETTFCPPQVCYSKSRVDNANSKWVKCYVDKYHKINRLFRVVQWDQDDLGMKPKWVSRLNLILASFENKEGFEASLIDAQESLKVEEDALTACMTLNCLASEYASPPKESLVACILQKVNVTIDDQKSKEILAMLVEETKQLYMRIDVILAFRNQTGKCMFFSKTILPSIAKLIYPADVVASPEVLIYHASPHAARQRSKRLFSTVRHPAISSPTLIRFQSEIRRVHLSLVKRSFEVITAPSELVTLEKFRSDVLEAFQNFQLYIMDYWFKPILNRSRRMHTSWDCIIFPNRLNKGKFPLKRWEAEACKRTRDRFFHMLRMTCNAALTHAKDCLYSSLKQIVFQQSNPTKLPRLLKGEDPSVRRMHFQVECDVRPLNNGRGFNNSVQVSPSVDNFQCVFSNFVQIANGIVHRYNEEIQSKLSNMNAPSVAEVKNFQFDLNKTGFICGCGRWEICEICEASTPEELQIISLLHGEIDRLLQKPISTIMQLSSHEDVVLGSDARRKWVIDWYKQFANMQSMVDALPFIFESNFAACHDVVCSNSSLVLENDLFILSLVSYKTILCESWQLLSRQLGQALVGKVNVVCRVAFEKYSEIVNNLNAPIATAQELQERIEFVSTLDHQVAELKGMYERCAYVYDALNEIASVTSENDCFALRWETARFPSVIITTIPETMKTIKRCAETFTNDISKGETAFFEQCKLALEAVAPLRHYSLADLSEAGVFAYNTAKAADNLSICQKRAQQLDIDRQILGMDSVDYGHVANGYTEAQHYARLWQLANEIEQFYDQIMGRQVNLYSHREGNRLVNLWLPRLHEIKRVFSSIPIPYRVIESLTSKLVTLKKHRSIFPLLTAETLRPRHWAILRERLGLDAFEQNDFIVGNAANDQKRLEKPFLMKEAYGILLKHVGGIRSCVMQSKRENEIELMLEAMKAEWGNLVVRVEPIDFQFDDPVSSPNGTAKHKTKPDVVFQAIDNAAQLQEVATDQLVQTNKLIAVRYAAWHLQDLEFWQNYLQGAIETIELWQNCEKVCKSVVPLCIRLDTLKCTSTNFTEMINLLKRKWQTVIEDAIYSRTAQNFFGNSELHKYVADTCTSVYQLSYSIQGFLYKKKTEYPPLFFIKDSILTDMLGLEKVDFGLVAKCIPHVKDISQSSDEQGNIYVNKIVTSCDEIISLTNPIFVGSSVEIGEICNSISNEMKESIKLSNDKINILHLGENLIQWIMKTDIVLQIKILRLRQLWCQSIERVMSAQNIPHPYEDILQQFQNLAVTVLSKIPHSSDKLRFTLSSVYAVLQPMITQLELLRCNSCVDSSSYEWTIIPRVYDRTEQSSKSTMTIAIHEHEIEYRYSVFNFPQSYCLVISSITERCIFAILQHVGSLVGAVVSGPIGSGKSSSIIAAAELCGSALTFLSWNILSVEKTFNDTFRGILGGGNWVCLEGLEHCSPTVLSALATIILRMRSLGQTQSISVGGKGTRVHRHSHCLGLMAFPLSYKQKQFFASSTKDILLNPRAGFPAIHTVSMPSWKRTAELMIATSGIPNLGMYENKVEALFKEVNDRYCKHNKFYRSILAKPLGFITLGKIIRNVQSQMLKNLDSYRDLHVQIWINALRETLHSSINTPDHSWLDCTIYTMFLGKGDIPVPTVDAKEESAFRLKMEELNVAISSRKGLYIVGSSMVGKSSILRKCASESLGAKYITVLLPGTLSPPVLYGSFDSLEQWNPGVIEVILASAKEGDDRVKTTKNKENWVVFDGEIDELWFSIISSVLRKPEHFNWGSKATINGGRGYKYIFEVTDLKSLSPSGIYNCATVHMGEDVISWRKFAIMFINQTFVEQRICGYIILLIDEILPDVFQLSPNVSNHTKKLLANQFLLMLRSIVPKNMRSDSTKKNIRKKPVVLKRWQKASETITDNVRKARKQEMKTNSEFSQMELLVNSGDNNLTILRASVVFSIEWAFRTFTGESNFSENFMVILKAKLPSVFLAVPKGLTIHDCFYDRGQNTWTKWEALQTTYNSQFTKGNTVRQNKTPSNHGQESLSWIVAPTQNILRTSWVLPQLVQSRQHVYLAGPSGSGKTCSWKFALSFSQMDSHSTLCTHLHSYSSASQFEKNLRSKLSDRKNCISAPLNGQYLNVIIEDLNLVMGKSKEITTKYRSQQSVFASIRGRLNALPCYNEKLKLFQKIEGVLCLLVGRSGLDSEEQNQSPEWNRCKRHAVHCSTKEHSKDDFYSILAANCSSTNTNSSSILRNIAKISSDAFALCRDIVATKMGKANKDRINTFRMVRFWKRIVAIVPHVAEPTDIQRLWWQELGDCVSDYMAGYYDSKRIFNGIASLNVQHDVVTHPYDPKFRIWRHVSTGSYETVELHEKQNEVSPGQGDNILRAVPMDTNNEIVDDTEEKKGEDVSSDDGINGTEMVEVEMVSAGESENEATEIEDSAGTDPKSKSLKKEKKKKGKKGTKGKSPKKKRKKPQKRGKNKRKLSKTKKAKKNRKGGGNHEVDGAEGDAGDIAEGKGLPVSSTFWQCGMAELLERFKLPIDRSQALIVVILRLIQQMQDHEAACISTLIAPPGFRGRSFVLIAASLCKFQHIITLDSVENVFERQLFYKSLESQIEDSCALIIRVKDPNCASTVCFINALVQFAVNKSLVELREICSSNTDEIANSSGANEALGHSKIKIVLLFSSMEAWIDLCTRQCSSVFRLAETINIRLAWGLRNTLFAVATTAWMPLVNSFEGALASDKITKKTRAKLESSHNLDNIADASVDMYNSMALAITKVFDCNCSGYMCPSRFIDILVAATGYAQTVWDRDWNHLLLYSSTRRSVQSLKKAKKDIIKLLKRQDANVKQKRLIRDTAKAKVDGALSDISKFFVNTNEDAKNANENVQSSRENLITLEHIRDELTNLKSVIVAQLRSTEEDIVAALSLLKIDNVPAQPVTDMLHIYVYLLQASHESDLMASNPTVNLSHQWPSTIAHVIQPDFISSIISLLEASELSHSDDECKDDKDDEKKGLVAPMSAIENVNKKYKEFIRLWDTSFQSNEVQDDKGRSMERWVELLFEALTTLLKYRVTCEEENKSRSVTDKYQQEFDDLIASLMQTEISCTEKLDVLNMCHEELEEASVALNESKEMAENTRSIMKRSNAILKSIQSKQHLWDCMSSHVKERFVVLPLLSLALAFIEKSLGIFGRSADRINLLRKWVLRSLNKFGVDSSFLQHFCNVIGSWCTEKSRALSENPLSWDSPKSIFGVYRLSHILEGFSSSKASLQNFAVLFPQTHYDPKKLNKSLPPNLVCIDPDGVAQKWLVSNLEKRGASFEIVSFAFENSGLVWKSKIALKKKLQEAREQEKIIILENVISFQSFSPSIIEMLTDQTDRKSGGGSAIYTFCKSIESVTACGILLSKSLILNCQMSEMGNDPEHLALSETNPALQPWCAKLMSALVQKTETEKSLCDTLCSLEKADIILLLKNDSFLMKLSAEIDQLNLTSKMLIDLKECKPALKGHDLLETREDVNALLNTSSSESENFLEKVIAEAIFLGRSSIVEFNLNLLNLTLPDITWHLSEKLSSRGKSIVLLDKTLLSAIELKNPLNGCGGIFVINGELGDTSSIHLQLKMWDQLDSDTEGVSRSVFLVVI